MSNRAHGRGAIAAIGLLVLFAGVVGGVVLWIVAAREPNNAAEGFARAAPGCTTTVTFSEAGEYYVYEELSGVVATVEGCEATTTSGQAFAFDIRPPGGQPIDRITDTSVSYDLDAGQGTSVARVTIDVPGDFAVSVLGNDPAINAAIGDDPEAGVDQLRQGAIAALIVGIVVGGLLLWLAGRRSRKAATFTSPVDPGWGVTERDRERRAAAAVEGSEWAAPVSGAQQVPVNPHQPDERRTASPTDSMTGGAWASSTDRDLPEPVLVGDTPSTTETSDDVGVLGGSDAPATDVSDDRDDSADIGVSGGDDAPATDVSDDRDDSADIGVSGGDDAPATDASDDRDDSADIGVSGGDDAPATDASDDRVDSADVGVSGCDDEPATDASDDRVDSADIGVSDATDEAEVDADTDESDESGSGEPDVTDEESAPDDADVSGEADGEDSEGSDDDRE